MIDIVIVKGAADCGLDKYMMNLHLFGAPPPNRKIYKSNGLVILLINLSSQLQRNTQDKD